jgi:hypothetical protein
MMIETPYGVVSSDENDTQVYATRLMLWDWANRRNSEWPCSVLKYQDEVTVTFDSKGDLVDISPDVEDLMSDELKAWSSDVLTMAGLSGHPAINEEGKRG